MTNNDILRRLRFTLNKSEQDLVKMTAKVNYQIEESQIEAWLKDEESEDYRALQDPDFAAMLDGLILDKRGPREDGVQPPLEPKLNNNIILRKLKIAFDLKNDEILELLTKVDFKLSKHELSAFFRREGHKHYRELKDQILRNFLASLQQKIRPIQEGSDHRSNDKSTLSEDLSTSSSRSQGSTPESSARVKGTIDSKNIWKKS